MDFTKYFQKLKSAAENARQQEQANKSENILPIAEEPSTAENLSKIKHIIENPKEDSPDARFNEIKDIVSEAEYYQTVREERWQPTVYCPNCHSTNIQVLAKEQQIAPHNFRYLCLMCRSRFNDDTKAPFEFSMPPLDVWIQCWFLLGCSNSLEYVAAKLNLDISIVKQMVKELQDTFKVKQPLTRTMSYEEWSRQYSQTFVHRVKEEILGRKRNVELHHGEATGQPKDTAELKRQKQRKVSQKIPPKNKRF